MDANRNILNAGASYAADDWANVGAEASLDLKAGWTCNGFAPVRISQSQFGIEQERVNSNSSGCNFGPPKGSKF